MDLYWDVDCVKCKEALRRKAVVLQFGIGPKYKEAIIQCENGKLEVVPINRLTVIKEGEK